MTSTHQATAAPDLKVCGLTGARDAQAAIATGATWLGAVLATRSPRRATPAQVRRIARVVRRSASTRLALVVAHQPLAPVLALAKEVGADAIQLHGGYGADDIARVQQAQRVVIWATPVDPSGRLLRPQDLALPWDILLLDVQTGQTFGGTGVPFDWAAMQPRPTSPFWVAGGLGPDDLVPAWRACQADGVDLSSRLERAPGKKDPAALAALGNAYAALRQQIPILGSLSDRQRREVR